MLGPLFDLDDGDAVIDMGGNMGIDSDGHVMINMGGNIVMDTETGEVHITSGWPQDDDKKEKL